MSRICQNQFARSCVPDPKVRILADLPGDPGLYLASRPIPQHQFFLIKAIPGQRSALGRLQKAHYLSRQILAGLLLALFIK